MGLWAILGIHRVFPRHSKKMEVLVNKHDRRGERQSAFRVSELVLYLQPFLQLVGVGPDAARTLHCLQSTKNLTHAHHPVMETLAKATATTMRTSVVPVLSEGGNIAKKE